MTLACKTFKFMTSPATIDETMVREPHEALGVSTVALFRKDGESYGRVTSSGGSRQSARRWIGTTAW